MTFSGFPSRSQSTAIPNVFFTDLLPRLTDALELAVVLYAFNVITGKRGFPRYLTLADLEAEPGLTRFLANAGAADGVVAAALGRAVDLGILLTLSVERDGGARHLYFLNAPADRRALESVRARTVDLGLIASPRPAVSSGRSGIFTLYESLVGTISPLIADELAEAERLYPADWLEGAFREAAAQNARSWRYVSRILERWAIEGPEHAKAGGDPAEERYFAGKYGRILKQRLKP